MKAWPMIGIAATVWGSPAFAAEGQRVAAESLFAEGRSLMSAGRAAEACDKFAASQRLDPAVGTSLNLAACFEQIGRTASAWAQFRSAAAAARKAGSTRREVVAARRARALEPRLARLVISAPTGVRVQRNGVAVPSAALASAIPVDPGVHQIRATAPGMAPWTTKVTVTEEGQQVEVEVPVLSVLAAPVAVPRRASGVLPAAATDEAGRGTEVGSSTWAWVSGGVGLAGVAAGTYFGMRASSSWDEAQGLCSAGYNCRDAAFDRRSEALSQANSANLAWAVGASGLAVATFLLWSSSKPSSHRSEVAIGPQRLLVRGTF